MPYVVEEMWNQELRSQMADVRFQTGMMNGEFATQVETHILHPKPRQWLSFCS